MMNLNPDMENYPYFLVVHQPFSTILSINLLNYPLLNQSEFLLPEQKRVWGERRKGHKSSETSINQGITDCVLITVSLEFIKNVTYQWTPKEGQSLLKGALSIAVMML